MPRETSYSHRTVVLTFTDPTLPYQLSKLVKVRSRHQHHNGHLVRCFCLPLCPCMCALCPVLGESYDTRAPLICHVAVLTAMLHL